MRTAVFDKTGTLTHGGPTLHGIRVSPAASGLMTEDRLLQLAASAEQYSSHVLASSVVEAARRHGLRLLSGSNAFEHATEGVTATCGNQTVVVGKPDFVRSVASGFEEAEVTGGQLAVYVGVDGRFAGALIMSDPLRENAVDTLAALRRLGVQETLRPGNTACHRRLAGHRPRNCCTGRDLPDSGKVTKSPSSQGCGNARS
ncbi:HAD family hydrolase [Pseudarthrobacter sp. NIBRBAC000502772]|uniref:HAD family hydrolase n=1 Tax=Pseudarthrobacter sp. NIBRBAC000502772 TaxID=2590775 RepID=UPI00352C0ECF